MASGAAFDCDSPSPGGAIAEVRLLISPCTKSGTRNLNILRLKIAFIATSYIPQRDGVSIYLENLLAEVLHGRGPGVGIDRIDVFIGQYSLPTLSSLLQRQLDHLGCGEAMGRVRFCPVSYAHIAWEPWHVPRMVRKNGPHDLIVMPNMRPFLMIGKPTLSILHDLTYKVAARHVSTWRRMYSEVLVSWRLARDDFIGVVSSTTRSALLQHYPWAARKRLVQMPNGLPFKLAWIERPSTAVVEQKLTRDRLSFVVVGRINYLKGFDRVIKACEAIDAYLARSDISITLHVVGKETSEAKRLFSDKVLKKTNIRRHGYIDDETLNALYRDSAFCFFLSRNEGFGLPLIEALWFCCVPILSDLPIFREVMGEDFPLFDMEGAYGVAIADFIVRLRDDEAFRQGLLEKMERVLGAHRDGYATAARKAIKLCTAPV
jgi:glycosyltransferase involved in cell wall biosynthesis